MELISGEGPWQEEARLRAGDPSQGTSPAAGLGSTVGHSTPSALRRMHPFEQSPPPVQSVW